MTPEQSKTAWDNFVKALAEDHDDTQALPVPARVVKRIYQRFKTRRLRKRIDATEASRDNGEAIN